MSTGIFIDTNSLYLTTRTLGIGKINYDALLEHINDPHAERYAYGIQINNRSSTFIKYLNHMNFETYFKNAYIAHNNPKESLLIQTLDISIKMTVDILSKVDSINTYIIVTSNPTIHTLLKYLKSIDKKIILALVKENDRLTEYTNNIIDLSNELFIKPSS